MDPAKLFEQKPDLVYVRLALEEWAELPPEGSPDWEALTGMISASTQLKSARVIDTKHNGVDVYLVIRLELSASVDALVAELRQLLGDPFWRPFIDLERYAWLGDFHAVSVPPNEKLEPRSLEHPSRAGKRRAMERDLGRELTQPWHEAPAPEVVGLELVECTHTVRGKFFPDAEQFNLWLRKPRHNRDEARAAAHLNIRLRMPGGGPMFESVGWDWAEGLFGLVFRIPVRHLPERPENVEVWWATDTRRQVGTVPVREAASRG